MRTKPLSNIVLEYREGSSDKVYHAIIDAKDGGFVVNFAYGRRGSTLKTGTKTQHPVSCEEALNIYSKLVESKVAKGYRLVDGTKASTDIGEVVTDRDRRDTGLRPQLLNPIEEGEAPAYLSHDRWCAQEKFDGVRMLLRKSADGIVAVNRTGLRVTCPPAHVAALSDVPGCFVLDGESVGDTYHAFDLLENAKGDLRTLPYRERLTALEKQLGLSGKGIVVSETVYGSGKHSFLKRLRSANKEGVVFKDLNSPWTAGRPASGGTALKLKFWETCSCVVLQKNTCRSVELALGDKSVGNVTIPANHNVPDIGQVVEVRYLYVAGPGGSLYQPVYLGVRNDVCAEDCTVERQRLKYKAAA